VAWERGVSHDAGYKPNGLRWNDPSESWSRCHHCLDVYLFEERRNLSIHARKDLPDARHLTRRKIHDWHTYVIARPQSTLILMLFLAHTEKRICPSKGQRKMGKGVGGKMGMCRVHITQEERSILRGDRHQQLKLHP